MLIEGLGNVTFVNGILRVECFSVDPAVKMFLQEHWRFLLVA